MSRRSAPILRRMPPGGDHFEFGPFRLDSTTSVLWRDEEVVPLTPKATALLRALVEAGGDLVTKQVLMARVWPDTVVEEANLSVTISALRKVLDPPDEGGSYVQTVPRRGYRFAASIKTPKAPRMALAVLPLRYLGRDQGDHLGLGMADALIGRLTGLESLIVRSTGAVLRYANAAKPPREAGRELGVDAVLDGSVQRNGDRLRVSVRVSSSRARRGLWRGPRPSGRSRWTMRWRRLTWQWASSVCFRTGIGLGRSGPSSAPSS